MVDKKVSSNTVAEMRRTAEAKLSERRKKAATPPATEANARRLVHELQVHQIELEMQNEELVQARAEAEAALRQYTELYDLAPVGYLTLRRDGAISKINLTGANLLGVERGELIKRRLGVFVSVESRPQFSAFLDKVFTSGENKVCEIEILRKGSAPLWVHIEAAKDSNEHEICRVVMVDISKRKQAEMMAEKEKSLNDTIIDSTPGTFYMLDENGKYVRWNAYQRDEIVGKPENMVADTYAIDTIHPDDRDLIGSKIANVLKNGVAEIIEGRVLLRGGPAFRWLLMTGRRVVIDDSPYLLGIGIDITERKLVEEQLLQKMGELQRFYDVTVGRELMMIELKKEINELLKKNGQKEKYRIVE